MYTTSACATYKRTSQRKGNDISRPPFGTVITFLSVVVSVVHSAEPLGGSEPRKIIKCIYKEKEKNIFLFEKRKEKRENLF
jgi:hypothetical protein